MLCVYTCYVYAWHYLSQGICVHIHNDARLLRTVPLDLMSSALFDVLESAVVCAVICDIRTEPTNTRRYCDSPPVDTIKCRYLLYALNWIRLFELLCFIRSRSGVATI